MLNLPKSFGSALLAALVVATFLPGVGRGHGTVVYPKSRVYRIYESNPDNPSFALAANAVQIDGTTSYYTWNEVSRNIPQAVQAGLPPGFDYSTWMPDGEIASAGRTDPNSLDYPRTYAGLDQVSPDWPKTPVVAGSTITVDFLATAVHSPSVWDVWMTKPSWDPSMPLQWCEMEFLERPTVSLASSHFTFDLVIPGDRSGHHVLWVVWQRDDPAGEVFISTSDIEIQNAPGSGEDFQLATGVNTSASSSPDVKTATSGDTLTVELNSPTGSYDGTFPLLLASVGPTGAALPPLPGYPEVHLDPSGVLIAFDGAAAGVPLPPGELSFVGPIPIGFAGFSVHFQGIALAPSAATGNPITATDGHEIRVL